MRWGVLATAQRRSEVAGIRWQDVDLDQALWIIPREQTKSDRAHEVPLSALAIEILDGLPRMHAELVFPDCRHGRNPVSGFSKAKAITDKLVGDAAAPWRLHDLRRTAATGMARLGVSTSMISRVLNHANGHGVTGIYDRHGYLDEKRQALDIWGRRVVAIIRPETAENVVTLAPPGA